LHYFFIGFGHCGLRQLGKKPNIPQNMDFFVMDQIINHSNDSWLTIINHDQEQGRKGLQINKILGLIYKRAKGIAGHAKGDTYINLKIIFFLHVNHWSLTKKGLSFDFWIVSCFLFLNPDIVTKSAIRYVLGWSLLYKTQVLILLSRNLYGRYP
jgi:hypothetical protein